jgi:hypothetical protein
MSQKPSQRAPGTLVSAALSSAVATFKTWREAVAPVVATYDQIEEARERAFKEAETFGVTRGSIRQVLVPVPGGILRELIALTSLQPLERLVRELEKSRAVAAIQGVLHTTWTWT